MQIRDTAMTAQEIGGFGGPSASGIPLFPPCPANLSCIVDQDTRTATLGWKNGHDTKSTGYVIRRNGETVGTAALDEESFTDTGLTEGFNLYELLIEGAAECPVLSCRVLVVGEHFLFDDFDNYEADEELTTAGWVVRDENNPVENAAWTITNPGGQRNPPTVDGGETFEGTPVFSYNGGGLFDSEEDPFYGAYVLEVPRAAGQSDVAFAFHYATSGVPSTWWALDDVSVTGTPGSSGRNEFRRGDVSDIGGVNITSAVFILNFLFTDAVDTLPCMDAGDINNDGTVNITDPVGLLNHLFGAAAPPPPRQSSARRLRLVCPTPAGRLGRADRTRSS